MIISPRLANICSRALIDTEIANKVLEIALKKNHPESKNVWAEEVILEDKKYVVGQGDISYFVCFPCPFNGHRDDWEVILPINSAQDLLKQLKGSQEDNSQEDNSQEDNSQEDNSQEDNSQEDNSQEDNSQEDNSQEDQFEDNENFS